MMERIVLIGGGGHRASVIDAIRSVGGYGVADSRPEDATVLEAESPAGAGRFSDDLVRRLCSVGEVHT